MSQIFYHDTFNLIALPLVVGCYLAFALDNGINIYINTHHLYTLTFLGYIILDTIWIICVPKCVASFKAILIHHIIVSIALYLVYLNIEFALISCHGVLIEVNTFFLIAKRIWKYKVLNYLFYITWIIFRLGSITYLFCSLGLKLKNDTFNSIYPINSIEFLKEIYAIGILVILTIILNVLNIKWTITLFSKANKFL